MVVLLNRHFLRRLHYTLDHKYTKMILLFFLMLGYASSGFLYYETPEKPDLNWYDAIWWAFVTMTTVGYGDLFPESFGGRYIIALPTMIIGIGMLGFIISEVSAKLIETQSNKLRGMANLKISDHIIIVNFTQEDKVNLVIKELKSDEATEDRPICIIDETLDSLPKSLVEAGVHFVKGNPTNEEVLTRANIQEAAYALLLSKDPSNPHSDDMNLSACLVIEKLMNSEIFSVVEVVDPKKIKQFKLAGCDSTICISEFSASLITQELLDPGFRDILLDLTSNRFGDQLYITSLGNQNGKSFRDLVLWCLDNSFTAIGVIQNGDAKLNCPPATPLGDGDRAILLGRNRIEQVQL